MKWVAIDNGDDSCELTVHFYDEGVVLSGSAHALCRAENAGHSAEVLAADLRHAHASLFPVPAPVEYGEPEL